MVTKEGELAGKWTGWDALGTGMYSKLLNTPQKFWRENRGALRWVRLEEQFGQKQN
jgi:hypothetical protein